MPRTPFAASIQLSDPSRPDNSDSSQLHAAEDILAVCNTLKDKDTRSIHKDTRSTRKDTHSTYKDIRNRTLGQ